MVNRYSIEIVNKSASDQNYIIFSEPPKVIGGVQGKILSYVLESAETPQGQQATFTIIKRYYATCGTSHGSLDDGIAVNVRGFTPVQLGTRQGDGTLVPGTTLDLVVRKDAPSFAAIQPTRSADTGAFEVNTSTDFTAEDAKDNNFTIGVSASPSGKTVPMATFIPEPNLKYQIYPVETYHVAYGDFTPGAAIDMNMIGQTVPVDFTHVGPSVKVIHDDHGTLIVQSA